MGRTRRAQLFDRCPVGVVRQDEEAQGWLRTYHVWRRFGHWPPGREDPQRMEAFVVIQNERDLIEHERTPPTPGRPAGAR